VEYSCGDCLLHIATYKMLLEIIIVVICLAYVVKSYTNPLCKVPGPWQWPPFGNMLQMDAQNPPSL
jgi:hypothetical protein